MDSGPPAGRQLPEPSSLRRERISRGADKNLDVSDDPAQRGLLGTDGAAHVATHAAMAQTVLAFLQEALGSRTGTFDGAELAERYRDRDLRARFVAASAEQDNSGGPE